MQLMGMSGRTFDESQPVLYSNSYETTIVPTPTHANPMYVERLSCPILAPSLLPTPTAPPFCPSPSRLLKRTCEIPPCITASDTASLHLGQIKDVMYSYFDGYIYTALRRSLKNADLA